MILGVLIVNTSGLTRFAKFYEFVSAACQQDIQRIVYEQLSSREDTKTCNFATPQPPSSDSRLIIYQRFASLYFVVLANQSESLLGILDIIRVFVMALEDCFPNVCELDIAYNPDKVAMVLAQIVSGGMVIETNLSRIHPLT
ncbi:snare-like protein [Ramicandelaber brevisporus]|nr:snare-like protein [Ramicandelaber brevisporus]